MHYYQLVHSFLLSVTQKYFQALTNKEGQGLEINSRSIQDVELSRLKYYCLEKAVEVFKYNQAVTVLELAEQFEKYLTIS
jgi:hypothetical protein